MVLFASFIILVLTGFALKFPDSWFASLLGMGEKLRGIIHRTAGVVLISTGFYHLVYALLTRDGRRLLRDVTPIAKDAVDLVGTMKYYLGLGPRKPEFNRFSYAEKAEYWALVWGLIVMAATGIMLWAKVQFGNLLPRWWLDIATAIHFYEAVLATLATVVWHFYQVFFDPDIYPMNWTWWDGKMSFEHYREEHALDSQTIFKAAECEADTESRTANSDTVPSNRDGQTIVEHQPSGAEEIAAERHS
jgi:cytochrome b subunit of formate dehydrogenase